MKKGRKIDPSLGFFLFMAIVIISASVERFCVSHIWEFFIYFQSRLTLICCHYDMSALNQIKNHILCDHNLFSIPKSIIIVMNESIRLLEALVYYQWQEQINKFCRYINIVSTFPNIWIQCALHVYTVLTFNGMVNVLLIII